MGKYNCDNCQGTGEAPEAKSITVRGAINEVADDFEANMLWLSAMGADFSVVIGDAIDAMRSEVIRLDRMTGEK